MTISATQSESPVAGAGRFSAVLPSNAALSAVLAHELTQPLAALLLYLQSARRDARDRNAALDKACQEAERASAILLRMRRFAARRRPECRPVDLRLLIDDAIELALVGHVLRVRLAHADDAVLPKVSADPVQIQQVLVNLMRNALQATAGRADGEIRVSTARCGPMAELTVEDNGPGVAPERRADLFDVFASGTRGGLGLGLPISRAIAEDHHGELELELAPRPPGRGAAFVLRLPIAGGGEVANVFQREAKS